MGRSADFVGIAKPAANPPRPSPDLSPLRGERGAAAPFFSSPRSRGEGCGDAFFPLFPLAGRGRVRGAGDGRRPAKRAARRILPGRWAVPPRFVTFLQHAAGKRRLGPKFGIFGFEGRPDACMLPDVNGSFPLASSDGRRRLLGDQRKNARGSLKREEGRLTPLTRLVFWSAK